MADILDKAIDSFCKTNEMWAMECARLNAELAACKEKLRIAEEALAIIEFNVGRPDGIYRPQIIRLAKEALQKIEEEKQ